MKNKVTFTLLVLLVCTAAIVGGVVTSASPKLDIVQRRLSPDSILEVVRAMPETGATDGFVNWLYIVKRGEPLTGEPVFVADQVDGELGLIWESNEQIMIKAKSARVFKSEPATIDLPGGTRKVTLRLNIAYPRAP